MSTLQDVTVLRRDYPGQIQYHFTSDEDTIIFNIEYSEGIYEWSEEQEILDKNPDIYTLEVANMQWQSDVGVAFTEALKRFNLEKYDNDEFLEFLHKHKPLPIENYIPESI